MKIYFLHNGLQSFVAKDLAILRGAHEVRSECNHGRLLRNFLPNLAGVRWCDLLFCWFTSIHFLPAVWLAKLFGKKVVIVAGGYDVVSLPDIRYGSMRGGLKTRLVRSMLRRADRVISISQSNRRETLENARVDPEGNVMIYHGFEPVQPPAVTKQPMVITAGGVNKSNLQRKGIADFVRVARFFPDIPFWVVGGVKPDARALLEPIPANVRFTGFLDEPDLSDAFARAKVYVQPSRHEGFGCSVAEAMLQECVPVVSDLTALPEVVGETGFLVKPGDEADLKEKIRLALACDPSRGREARTRVLTEFPLEMRRKKLLEVVSQLDPKRGGV